MELTEEEYRIVTNHWGAEIPKQLGEIDPVDLVDMLRQIARAVGATIEEGDLETLELLESLERKLEEALLKQL